VLHLFSEVVASFPKDTVNELCEKRDHEKDTNTQRYFGLDKSIGSRAVFPVDVLASGEYGANDRDDLRMYQRSDTCSIHTQYFLALGGISETSTGSNSNFGSSASGAKYAFVVFSQFLSSRSGKSGL